MGAINIHGTVGELWSKLHKKNKNDTNISLYQIYLPKLHGNILKYYESNLFKEIPIVFKHGFFHGRLDKFLNVAIILSLNSSLVLHRVLFVSNLIMPHI